MNKLTEMEKYQTILCVKYAKHQLEYSLLKREIEYEKLNKYDKEFDAEIEQLNDSIQHYNDLIKKLEEVL